MFTPKYTAYYLLAMLALSSCATAKLSLNEGSSRMMISKPDANGSFQEGAIFFRPNPNEERQPSPIIEKNDYISVKLVSAFICDFRESASIGDVIANSNNNSTICTGGVKDFDTSQSIRQTRGEILIIANVGEQLNNQNLSFDPASVRDKGRVIYYNPDIRESGQLINAINLPIYGPKQYVGYPFFFDFTLMELDNDENEEIKALLGTLADLGTAATANPLISSVVKPLTEALVNANGDDLEMRYLAGFDIAGADDSQIHRMRLSEGYYAFIRKEARSQIASPSEICVDAERGLLLVIAQDNQRCILNVESNGSNNVYRNSTWLLLRVAKESPDSPQVDQMTTLESVNDFLNRSKVWNEENRASTMNSFKQLTNVIATREKVAELPKFKGQSNYFQLLTNKLQPLGSVANTLTEVQLKNEQTNSLILRKLSSVVSNMPCFPQHGDTNYDAQITSLKSITSSDTSIEAGKIKVSNDFICN